MARFIMIYKGEATDMSAMSEQDAADVMAKWGAWMEQIGPALDDVGSPFGPGVSVLDDGSTADVMSLTGYSIVQAASLDEAQSLTDGHPYLSDGQGEGDYSIELLELMPVPFEE